jgi:hypothetical protein
VCVHISIYALTFMYEQEGDILIDKMMTSVEMQANSLTAQIRKVRAYT